MSSLFSKLKSPKKAVKTNLTMEYLIILRKSGLPIYSKCWGNFCAVLTVDDTLLSGFLSAMTTMPAMFNQDTTVRAVEMGFSKLLFNYTTPSGHIICGGFRREEVTDQSTKLINGFFTQIEKLLEGEYKNQNWDDIPDADMKKFETKLMDEVVMPWFHTIESPNHSDDMCPFCSTGMAFKGENNTGMKAKFSDRISNIYTFIKGKFSSDPSFADKKEGAIQLRKQLNKRANIES